MMWVKTVKVLLLVFCGSNCSGFLLDGNTPGSSGQDIDTTHYTDLMDMLTQERNYRKQLEKYLSVELQQTLNNLKNQSATLKTKSQDIKAQNEELQRKITLIEKRSGSKDIIDKLKTQVLTSEQMAEKRIAATKNSIDIAFVNMSTAQGDLVKNISKAGNQIQENKGMVAFQGCTGYFDRNKKHYIFKDLRTSYGFKNLSSLQNDGIFKTEISGLYLVLTSIMSWNSESRINVVKNNSTILTQVEITPKHGRMSRNSMYHTGTASAVVQLREADTIVLQAHNVDGALSDFNCLSIVKIH